MRRSGRAARGRTVCSRELPGAWPNRAVQVMGTDGSPLTAPTHPAAPVADLAGQVVRDGLPRYALATTTAPEIVPAVLAPALP